MTINVTFCENCGKVAETMMDEPGQAFCSIKCWTAYFARQQKHREDEMKALAKLEREIDRK